MKQAPGTKAIMKHIHYAHGGPVESCSMCMGGYDEGGDVHESAGFKKLPATDESGDVHESAGFKKRPGTSYAGIFTEIGNEQSDPARRAYFYGRAKKEHKEKLGNLVSDTQDRKNLAQGGEVGSIYTENNDMSGKGRPLPIMQPLGPKEIPPNDGHGHMAEGGEMEPDGDEGMDSSTLIDHCAGEMMDALKSGDKSAFVDALHVLVADLMQKMGSEPEEA
jgi:hypothetical protein